MLERLIRCLLPAAVLVLATCVSPAPPPARVAAAPSPLPSPVVIASPAPAPSPARVVHDTALVQTLERGATQLLDRHQAVLLADLKSQFGRKQCSLPLLVPLSQKLTPGQIYEQCQRSVLTMGGMYKCDKCTRWHANTSCGFPITASGAVVTNYHVLADKRNQALVAMTAEGAVFSVKEVLAANAEDDVAIVQLDTKGAVLPALALAPRAPVGTPVCLISHPDRHFYVLTCGMVSRYSEREKNGKSVLLMDITADYARGSSGAPVFNDQGAVVGLVATTESIYYDVADGKKENLQMVFKHCVPAENVLKLIRR